ncbi:MAG TPA: AMP-binding protein [Smithellaceae bacterium]|nr:AMP-binding protein [Smithella sp.]HPV50134.1 AMP-binding protein [Smithellaceae bacterium]
MNMERMLQETTGRYPENPAIIYEGKRISYETLNRFVESLARHLQELGIRKGDKVAIMLANCPEFIISYFAALRLGAVAVTLNVMSTAYELQHLVENSDARVFITADNFARRFEAVSETLPFCRHLITTGGLKSGSPFDKIIQSGQVTVDAPALEGSDPAVMIYTAGLTGKPLGAVLTYDNLATQADLLRTICSGTQDDRSLAVIPLFHSFGAAVNMLCPLCLGGAIVLMDRFTMEGIFTAIQKEQVTYLSAVPRLFMGMLFHDKLKEYNLSSLRFGITGGSPMAPELFAEFEKHLGIRVLEGYGLTETSPCCIFTMPDKVQKPGSIGTVLPGVQAKVLDDAGGDVPAGVVGELVVRGDVVMQGYYKDEAATAEVIRQGWLHTGDLAHMDEEGYVFLDGVKKRMVITSGFNVYPKEVELILEMHPGVVSSKVVGEKDLMRGEIVKALIVKKLGDETDEKEIIQHCRNYLSSYKVPREVVFVSELD